MAEFFNEWSCYIWYQKVLIFSAMWELGRDIQPSVQWRRQWADREEGRLSNKSTIIHMHEDTHTQKKVLQRISVQFRHISVTWQLHEYIQRTFITYSHAHTLHMYIKYIDFLLTDTENRGIENNSNNNNNTHTTTIHTHTHTSTLN